MSRLFYFPPNNVFVVSAVDEGVGFAGGGVVKKNSTLYTLAEKEVTGLGEEFFLLSGPLDK
jgi:hypothetical protein